MIRALFDDADTDQSGSITFEELQLELEKHPGILENLTLKYDMMIIHMIISSVSNFTNSSRF